MRVVKVARADPTLTGAKLMFEHARGLSRLGWFLVDDQHIVAHHPVLIFAKGFFIFGPIAPRVHNPARPQSIEFEGSRILMGVDRSESGGLGMNDRGLLRLLGPSTAQGGVT